MSAAFDGVYNFPSWDISHGFMVAFMKYGGYIQFSFHSAVNTFMALERKCDEIVGKINSGMEETKVNEQIVRKIVLHKRW